MYRFNVWKLVLIIAVFVFSALYLIPTPDYLYNPLYGNLSLWMQENFPDFETTEDGALIVDLQDIQYPEGINFNDAVIELSDILRAQLGKQGLEEGVGYEFDTTGNREFLVKFTDEKSETELMAILTNLHLHGRIPTIARRLIPDNRLKLGLDLKGGVHLVLEVDLEESKNELLRENASPQFQIACVNGTRTFCAEKRI